MNLAHAELTSLVTTELKLYEFGFSATDKWAIKWLIKNILLTSFILCRFPLQRYINVEPLFKWTLMGMALIIAWLPCLKAYPIVSVMLMCLHAFLLGIGPLTSISMLVRNRRPDEIYASLLVHFPGFFIGLIHLYSWTRNGPRLTSDQIRCYSMVLTYAWTVCVVSWRENRRRQVGGTQQEAMDAIRHLHNE